MFSPIIIPMAAFVMVVLIVGIVTFAKLRDKEMQVHANLHRLQMEHQRRMKELEAELERLRHASDGQDGPDTTRRGQEASEVTAEKKP